MKPFSEEEQADRRRPWQKREGLRRIAVLTVAPTGVYALLVLVSLLGGPRIGAPLIPLPDPRGADAVSPVAGPLSSGLPTKVFPPILPETATPTPTTTPTPTLVPTLAIKSPGQLLDPAAIRTTGQVPGSTAGPQDPQTIDEPASPRSTGNRTAPTTAPPSPPTTATPTPQPTSPPGTPTDPPGNPDADPQPPTITDTLLALLHKLGL